MREKVLNYKFIALMLLLGAIGCICFGVGDYFLVYGNTEATADLYFMTVCTSTMPELANNNALLLMIPGFLFVLAALLTLSTTIKDSSDVHIYHFLMGVGLTAYTLSQFIYSMILYLYSYLNTNAIIQEVEDLIVNIYGHYETVLMICLIALAIPLIFWFYLVITDRTKLPQILALVNPVIIYGILSGVKYFIPVSPLKLGFTKAMVPEAFLIFFILLALWSALKNKKDNSWYHY